MSNKTSKERLFEKAACLLMLFTMGFYILSIIKKNSGALSDYAFVLGILSAVAIILLFASISFYVKTDRIAMGIIFVASLFFLTVWNLAVKSVPVSDYEVLWRGAHQIVEGTFHERAIRSDDYFCFYNFQIGYTFWLSILFRLFHGSIFGVKLVEILFISCTNIVLFKTLRLFTGLRTSFSVSAMFMCFPFVFIGSGVLNNQHEALLFEALAIYFFLKYAEKKGKRYVWVLLTL